MVCVLISFSIDQRDDELRTPWPRPDAGTRRLERRRRRPGTTHGRNPLAGFGGADSVASGSRSTVMAMANAQCLPISSRSINEEQSLHIMRTAMDGMYLRKCGGISEG